MGYLALVSFRLGGGLGVRFWFGPFLFRVLFGVRRLRGLVGLVFSGGFTA